MIAKVTQLQISKVGTPIQVCLAGESKLLVSKLVIAPYDQNRRWMCGCSEYCKGPRFYLKRLITVWTTGLNEIKFSFNIFFHHCMHAIQYFMADVLQCFSYLLLHNKLPPNLVI